MKPALTITILVISCLVLAGCASSAPSITLSPEPTPDQITITINGEEIVLVPGVNILPEIYEAVKSPEILEHSEWIYVDGYWDIMPKGVTIPLEVEEPQLPPQPNFPGFPENWITYFMPTLGLEFDHPSDWQVENLENGLQMISPDGSYQMQVESYPNPVGASVQVWLAEYGPELPGEVLVEYEESIRGQPVLLQQVLLDDVEENPAGETINLWMASGDRVYHWTAWPGAQPETYDLLIYMASTLR